MSHLYLFFGLLFCATSTEAQQLQLGYVHADSLIWKMQEGKELKLFRDTVFTSLKDRLENYLQELQQKYSDLIDYVTKRGCEPTEHLSKEIEQMTIKLERKAIEAEQVLVYLEKEIETYLKEELKLEARRRLNSIR